GGGGTVKFQISPPGYRNGQAHHILLDTNTNKLNGRKLSTKTRTTSLRRDPHQTTFL
ncbi:hypothetical protein GWI33_014111, partial [Rhynchophorus ferrugineus]